MHSSGLKETEVESIRSIFGRYTEISEVTLFGSRAMGNFKPVSDIDFAIKGEGISKIIGSLIDAFEESSLIYKVDIIDYLKISSEKLIQHIDQYGVLFYSK